MYNAVIGPSVVGSFVKTGEDVRDIQQRVRSARDELAAIIVTCHAKLSPAVQEQWTDMDLRAQAFAQEEPHTFIHAAAQYDRGVEILKDLDGWRKRLSGLGCADVPPGFNVPEDSGAGIESLLDKVLWLAAIIAGAVVASKVLK